MTTKLIYRGFNVEKRDNGKWYVLATDGELLSSPLASEDEAYAFVDRIKRMGMK